MIWRGSSGGFEAHPGTPDPSAPYSPFFITTEGKHPKGSLGHDKDDRRSREVERKFQKSRYGYWTSALTCRKKGRSVFSILSVPLNRTVPFSFWHLLSFSKGHSTYFQ